MSVNKRSLLRTLFTANAGCGNCGTPKPSDVHDPTPVPKISIHPNRNPTTLTSSSIPGERNGGSLSVDNDDDEEDLTSTTISEDQKSSKNIITRKLSGSIAVEKKSEDPYNDFPDSMLQMIIEKEIETDLQELLQWFLKLNSPCYHQLILKAFTDICQEASPPSIHTCEEAA